jgi:hypothetical protein
MQVESDFPVEQGKNYFFQVLTRSAFRRIVRTFEPLEDRARRSFYQNLLASKVV